MLTNYGDDTQLSPSQLLSKKLGTSIPVLQLLEIVNRLEELSKRSIIFTGKRKRGRPIKHG